jgi:hypothetical protein
MTDRYLYTGINNKSLIAEMCFKHRSPIGLICFHNNDNTNNNNSNDCNAQYKRFHSSSPLLRITLDCPIVRAIRLTPNLVDCNKQS